MLDDDLDPEIFGAGFDCLNTALDNVTLVSRGTPRQSHILSFYAGMFEAVIQLLAADLGVDRREAAQKIARALIGIARATDDEERNPHGPH